MCVTILMLMSQMLKFDLAFKLTSKLWDHSTQHQYVKLKTNPLDRVYSLLCSFHLDFLSECTEYD